MHQFQHQRGAAAAWLTDHDQVEARMMHAEAESCRSLRLFLSYPDIILCGFIDQFSRRGKTQACRVYATREFLGA
jgi:hypothetical protein